MQKCETCEGTGWVEEYCQMCNGSGEGMYDGATCWACRGKGCTTAPCEVCGGYGVVDEDGGEE